MLKKFWTWYEGNYKLVLYVTTFLFLIQLVHLYWLTTNVVMLRIYGHIFWDVSKVWEFVIALADYTEIPAIITASILYINSLRFGFSWKSLLLLVFINSQWLHLFWITDEIIYAQFAGVALVAMPIWLSWIAISIDYLELPVIVDTTMKSWRELRKKAV